VAINEAESVPVIVMQSDVCVGISLTDGVEVGGKKSKLVALWLYIVPKDKTLRFFGSLIADSDLVKNRHSIDDLFRSCRLGNSDYRR